jgi:hypothetical protein
VTDVIIVDGSGSATRRPGGLSRWLADRAAAAVPGATPPSAKSGTAKSGTAKPGPGRHPTGKAAPAKSQSGGKPSASTLRHRLRDTEKELATLTRKRDGLNSRLEEAGAAADIAALARIGTELAEVTAAIEAVEERWLELAAESESG